MPRLELHLLQSFPPSNLNRDENGMPKSCHFGGRPRSRISSQCQKRAVRQFYHTHCPDLSPTQFAYRSRSWMPELKSRLEAGGIAPHLAQVAAVLALATLGAKIENDEVKSKSIFFLGRKEIDAIASILLGNWASIQPMLTEDKPALPKDPNIAKAIEKSLSGNSKPGDVALFGRMVASLPTVNVDAAVQMSHAISVNALQLEFDFFTAVDDLATDDRGADHMGETGFNSSCYYRFACVDTNQLATNLGSVDDAPDITKAFCQAFVWALPSGFQNSFAAFTLPTLAFAVVRKGQPISLVDAFESPARPSGGLSLTAKAVKQFDTHWADMLSMYRFSDIDYKAVVVRSSLAEHLSTLRDDRVEDVETLIDRAVEFAFSGS